MKTKLFRKKYILASVWFVITLGMLMVGRSFFYTINQEDYNNPNVEFYEVDLYENVIQQEVALSYDIEQLSFLITSFSEKEESISLEVIDCKDGQVLGSTEIILAPGDGEEKIIEWMIDEKFGEAKDVIVKIESAVEVADQLFVSVQENEYEQKYMENGEEKDLHIRMAVVYSRGYNALFMLFFFVLMLSSGWMFIFNFENVISFERMYLIAALLGGVAFAFLVPFGQEADGWVHFTRSMDVSYGNLFAPFWDNNGNDSLFRLPEDVNNVNFGVLIPGSKLGDAFADKMKMFHFSKEIVEVEVVGGFASLFYLPQAIGLFIARVLGLSSYGHMILGRLGNLFTYIGLTYYGLKKMPVYRNIYMVVALLPLSLYQAASFSYDALLYSLCFVFIALCLNYAYEKEKLNWQDVFKLGIILVLLLMCKYVYACIGLLVFMIPMKKFASTKEYWKSFVIALIPVVLMVLYVLPSLFAVSGNADMGTSAEVIQSTEPAQMTQLTYVLSNPFALVKVFIRTIVAHFQVYVRQLNVLGWLNYGLGNLETLVPIILCCVAFLDVNNKNKLITTKNKVIEIASFAIVVVVGMLGLYLVDSVANPVGAGVIAGYQGRYMIPVLTLFLAMFSSKNIENKIKNFSYKVLGVIFVVLAYAFVTLLQICY